MYTTCKKLRHYDDKYKYTIYIFLRKEMLDSQLLPYFHN